jgi:hypothetical protein
MLDLAEYAGKKVQFAFKFHAADPWPGGNISTGWYFDELEIVTGPLICSNPETWEAGIGNWSVDYGTWEVGNPTSGPGNAHGGTKCAGTVLGGNYAGTVDSRIISPPVTISNQPGAYLRFWHWFSFSTSDYGRVQIKPVDSSDWIDLSDKYTSTGGNAWTYPAIELTSYAGQKVQIAFQFHAEDPWPGGNISSGWYVDDVFIDIIEGVNNTSSIIHQNLSISPNPFTISTNISLYSDETGSGKIEIFDTHSRLVRVLQLQVDRPGDISISWDGKDQQGNVCPTGIYFLRFSQKKTVGTGKIIRV